MYKVMTVGDTLVATTEKEQDALIIAKKFANMKCTFTKVYCGTKLIAVFS